VGAYEVPEEEEGDEEEEDEEDLELGEADEAEHPVDGPRKEPRVVPPPPGPDPAPLLPHLSRSIDRSIDRRRIPPLLPPNPTRIGLIGSAAVRREGVGGGGTGSPAVQRRGLWLREGPDRQSVYPLLDARWRWGREVELGCWRPGRREHGTTWR